MQALKALRTEHLIEANAIKRTLKMTLQYEHFLEHCRLLLEAKSCTLSRMEELQKSLETVDQAQMWGGSKRSLESLSL